MHLGKRARNIYTILFVLLLTATTVSLAFNRSIWLDESFSLRWSVLPFSSFIKRIQLDVCPLYLFLMRIVLTLTGESLLAAKLFSAVALFLIFMLAATFVRKNFGLKSMTFMGLFLISMPMLMSRAVEVRMYTWAFLWVILSCAQMYYLVTDKNTKKHWILFTIFSLAGCYTHYFAVLSLVVLYVGLFVFYVFTKNWKEFKSWLICSVVTVLVYLPWVPNILSQTNSETTSWIPGQSSFFDVLRLMFYTNIPRTDMFFLVLIAGFCVIGFVLFCKYKTPELYWSLVCMSTYWLVWIFGIVFEVISRPILTRKYLMIPLCATILGLSYVCKYINKYIVAAICAVLLLVSIDVYQTVYKQEYGTKVEETLQFAEEYIKDTDIVLGDTDGMSIVVSYYFPERQILTDIYEESYDYLWYFDSEGTLDVNRLADNQISYIDYGEYGFDITFNIYYLYRE